MLIREIILETNSLTGLKDFYCNVLELEVINSNEKSFTVKSKNTNITFNISSRRNNPFYHFAFNIPENKFKEAKVWAKERVNLISLKSEDEFDFKSWNAHSIYFYDPAGNILELIARHNLDNQTDERFSGKSLLCISEIGMPVRDVKSFFETISKKFEIPFFSGDLKTFTAAGDDRGLFIIVPVGRKWFPDREPAESFPLTVVMSGESSINFQFEQYCIRSN